MRSLAEMGLMANRVAPFVPLPVASARFGEDKLMSGVLSFEVKYTGNPTFVSTGPTSPPAQWPTPFTTATALYPTGNFDFPYDFLPSQAGEFDTHGQPFKVAANGTQTGTLLPIRITGVQIRIRAMDVPTTTTRQTTFTVDL